MLGAPHVLSESDCGRYPHSQSSLLRCSLFLGVTVNISSIFQVFIKQGVSVGPVLTG